MTTNNDSPKDRLYGALVYLENCRTPADLDLDECLELKRLHLPIYNDYYATLVDIVIGDANVSPVTVRRLAADCLNTIKLLYYSGDLDECRQLYFTVRRSVGHILFTHRNYVAALAELIASLYVPHPYDLSSILKAFDS